MTTTDPAAARGLSGRGLQQSAGQWARRGAVLIETMSALASRNAVVPTTAGLDVGCQEGELTDGLARRIGGSWKGIDPAVAQPTVTAAGSELRPGWAHDLPYPTETFDVCVLANVFEHIDPAKRVPSLAEIRRVLRPGGILVGQIPNPYFFVESHSRLPLMGYLPVPAQKRYWRVAPVPWDHDFHVVTLKHVRRAAAAAGLTEVETQKFNYPTDVIPQSVQWAARALRPVTEFLPWAWLYVFRRP